MDQHSRDDRRADVLEHFLRGVAVSGRPLQVLDERVEVTGILVALACGGRHSVGDLGANRLQVRIVHEPQEQRRAVLVPQGQQHVVRRVGLQELVEITFGQNRAIQAVAQHARVE